jgi:Tfp pilus assembly protein PilF
MILRATLPLLLVLCTATARANWVLDLQTLLAKGDTAAALAAADAALARTPKDAQARFMHAVVMMEMQRNNDAMAAFTQLTQEYPELPEPFNNIALLHVRAGQLEPARQALETALRNDPSHRVARLNLGEVHLMLAVQAWDRAAAIAPLDARMALRLDSARALIGATALQRR